MRRRKLELIRAPKVCTQLDYRGPSGHDGRAEGTETVSKGEERGGSDEGVGVHSLCRIYTVTCDVLDNACNSMPQLTCWRLSQGSKFPYKQCAHFCKSQLAFRQQRQRPPSALSVRFAVHLTCMRRRTA